MTTLYKLTKPDFTTYNNCLWGENVTHETDGEGELCGPGWLHAYTDPYLAVILNPIHAYYNPALLWECEGEILKNDNGLKVGCTKLTTIKQIKLPEISSEFKIKFAINCALKVYFEPNFIKWATDWLTGTNRSFKAARAAYAATAADAAAAAADAARAARAAARAATDAAYAAADAAAAYAARAAYAAADAKFNLINIIQDMLKDQ